MTKIESGKKDRDLVELNLKEAAQSAIELAEPSADHKNVKIHLEAADDLVISADSGEIDMIFNNLISNAVKYNKDDGDVFVKIYGENDAVYIKVSDTGIGMSQEEQQKLFKEFSRIRNNKTADILGSGLGLSILKRLVELYEGDIKVESKPDEGTTFIINIPKK
jgi:signal transduction histidine kinase